jgi:PQ loop repeat
MSPLGLLGAVGMLAIEASYLPQIARLHRFKHADDMSYFFPALNAAGRVLALAYALGSHNDIFVGGFILGIALRLVLLGQVTWYRRRGVLTSTRALAS